MAKFHMETSGVETEWVRQGFFPNDGSKEILDHPKFHKLGFKITEPYPFSQKIEEYVNCLHSRQTFCQEAGNESALSRFDNSIREILAEFAVDGLVTFNVGSRIEWGRIKSPI